MLLIQQYNTHTHTSPVQESYILLATWDTPQRDYPQVSSQCRPTPAPPKNRGYNQGNASQLSLFVQKRLKGVMSFFFSFFIYLIIYLSFYLLIPFLTRAKVGVHLPLSCVLFLFSLQVSCELDSNLLLQNAVFTFVRLPALQLLTGFMSGMRMRVMCFVAEAGTPCDYLRLGNSVVKSLRVDVIYLLILSLQYFVFTSLPQGLRTLDDLR